VSKKRAPEIIILGIDGATWKVINQGIKKGLLPNFKKMINEGLWGDLLSTVPPVTAPAWTSLITGVNPGKHGIFDFLYHPYNSYEIRYLAGGYRKSKTIWSILSANQKKIGTINIPMTYPPEKLPEFMISGLDAPGENSNFVYPTSLKQELIDKFGEIPLDIHQLAHMKNDEIRDLVLKKLKKQEELRTEISFYLIENYPIDIFMLVFNATDQVQHHFWHYFDEKHDFFDEKGSKKYGNAIVDIYQIIDECIGKFLNRFPESTFFLVSDHGFKATSKNRLHLNNLLAETGLLTFKKTKTVYSTMVKYLYDKLRSSLPAHLKYKLASLFPKLRSKFESQAFLSNIDWENTYGFAWDFSPTSASIFVNLTHRFPKGIVPKKERLNIIKRIVTALDGVTFSDGQKLAYYLKEDVYKGENTQIAPDIIVDWWNGSFINSPAPFKKDFITLASNFKPGEDWSGIHDQKGIFVIYGENIKQNKKLTLNIVDIAPLVLMLCDLEIPEEFDGILNEELIESIKKNTKVKTKKIDLSSKESSCYSNNEEEEIQKKLKSLGYL